MSKTLKPSSRAIRKVYKKIVKDKDYPKMEYDGLCSIIAWNFHEFTDLKSMELFTPHQAEYDALKAEGLNTPYWASGSPTYRKGILTRLRETILIFMILIEDQCQEEAKDNPNWPLAKTVDLPKVLIPCRR